MPVFSLEELYIVSLLCASLTMQGYFSFDLMPQHNKEDDRMSPRACSAPHTGCGGIIRIDDDIIRISAPHRGHCLIDVESPCSYRYLYIDIDK